MSPDTWQQFLQGDENAFSELYCGYFNELFAYGLKIGVLGAWIDKADYPGEAPPEGYISYFSYSSPIRSFVKGDINSAIHTGRPTIYKDKGYTLTQNPGWE
jgi:hypothetical protein